MTEKPEIGLDHAMKEHQSSPNQHDPVVCELINSDFNETKEKYAYSESNNVSPKQEGYQSEGTITSLDKQTDTKDGRCDVEAE